jgi:hypothetical protein
VPTASRAGDPAGDDRGSGSGAGTMGGVMTTARTDPEAVIGEGSDDGSEPEFDPEHRTFQRMSVRGPALIVIGIAVFILVAGVVASVLAGSSTGKLSIKSLTLPDGTTVALTPATTALKPIISSEPPADILAALAVPAGSVEHHFVNTDQNVSQYDRSVSFTSGLSSDQVLAFYRTLLPKLGWHVTAVAPDPSASAGAGTTEVLATKGSEDGFYWEVGAVVSPSTVDGVTPFTIQLFEQDDQD